MVRDFFRCLFNVTNFVEVNNLQLVGLTWMVANNDDYVNFNNKVDEKEACKVYPCPKKNPSAATAVQSTLWMMGCIMVLLTFIH